MKLEKWYMTAAILLLVSIGIMLPAMATYTLFKTEWMHNLVLVSGIGIAVSAAMFFWPFAFVLARNAWRDLRIYLSNR